MVCPPPQFQKESEKEVRFLANPLSLFPPFAGATLGCYNVTIPQFSVDLLTCRAVPMGYKSVSLGWVYSRVSLSVWPLAVVRLAFTDKIRLTGQEMLLYLCWLLFQQPTAVKQANFGSQRIFAVVHTQSLYATLSRAFSQLSENSSAGHDFSPFFQNTSLSLFDFILKGCCKVKKQISQQSSTGSSLPLCILFILNFPLEPTENAWQREPGAQKSHYFLR